MAADDKHTPVAIRITRPYSSDEELLEHELDTISRTTVMLTGAQSRPQGVVLRFEVTLATGEPLLRGEGRVVGFRPAANGVESALSLRFTRLDARSKALVDRAAAMRDTRAGKPSLRPPPAPPPLPPRVPPSGAEGGPPTHRDVASHPLHVPPSGVVPPPIPPSAPVLDDQTGDATPYSTVARAIRGRQNDGDRGSPRPVGGPPTPLQAPASITPRLAGPAQRDELLDRLRQRAKALSPSTISSILDQKRRRARRA